MAINEAIHPAKLRLDKWPVVKGRYMNGRSVELVKPDDPEYVVLFNPRSCCIDLSKPNQHYERCGPSFWTIAEALGMRRVVSSPRP